MLFPKERIRDSKLNINAAKVLKMQRIINILRRKISNLTRGG